jgi:hypothetical protein
VSAAQHKPARADGHSYLWGQVFFTDPIGQWLCVSGRSCRWSIARTDAGVMARIQRRRGAIAKVTGGAS